MLRWGLDFYDLQWQVRGLAFYDVVANKDGLANKVCTAAACLEQTATGQDYGCHVRFDRLHRADLQRGVWNQLVPGLGTAWEHSRVLSAFAEASL